MSVSAIIIGVMLGLLIAWKRWDFKLAAWFWEWIRKR